MEGEYPARFIDPESEAELHLDEFPGSGVSIVTRYRMDGLGFEPWSGEIFSTHPEWPWGSPNVLYNGYRLSFQAVMRPGSRV